MSATYSSSDAGAHYQKWQNNNNRKRNKNTSAPFFIPLFSFLWHHFHKLCKENKHSFNKLCSSCSVKLQIFIHSYVNVAALQQHYWWHRFASKIEISVNTCVISFSTEDCHSIRKTNFEYVFVTTTKA